MQRQASSGNQSCRRILFKRSRDNDPDRGPDMDLVGNAAQKGRVHQVFRLQIGGKDHQLLKRNAEALAGVQPEIVHSALKRHNPAIEQVGGAHKLTPEIVNEKQPPSAFMCSGAS